MKARIFILLCSCAALGMMEEVALAQTNQPTSSESRLELIVFEHGEPLANHPIFINGVAYSLGPDGRLLVSVEDQASEFTIECKGQSETRELLFVDGLTTTLLMSFRESKSPVVQVIEPHGGAPLAASHPKVKDENGTSHLVRGKIVDQETGQGVPEVKVLIQSAGRQLKTDRNGEFTVELPVGEHSVHFIHPRYHTGSAKSLMVGRESANSTTWKLAKMGAQLPDVVVHAPQIQGSVAQLLEFRRETSNVSDVLGAEQISKSGDSDVGGALKRVTGLTLVDGKYVYVRGLGERYSSVLLNEFQLPSPDTTRRVIPLDMFPSSIIDSLVVQKSYSVDQPGEFGGGSVLLRTKAIPEDFVFSVSISQNYSGDRDKMVAYEGGSKDWLGFDDGTRQMPAKLQSATANGQKLKKATQFDSEGLSEGELVELGRSFSNNYNVEGNSKDLPPSFSVGVGNRWDLGRQWVMGFNTSVMYKNSQDFSDRESFIYSVDSQGLDPRETATHQISETDIHLVGMMDIGLEWNKKHRLQLSEMILRDTDNIIEMGNRQTDNDTYQTTELIWKEQQLQSHQISGSHHWDLLSGLDFKWRAAHSEVTSEEPDRRSYQYIQDRATGTYLFDTGPSGNERRFSTLEDKALDYGADWSLAIPIFKADRVLKWGFSQFEKSRDFQSKRFEFKATTEPDSDLKAQDMQTILSSDHIGPNGFALQEDPQNSDNYTGNHQVRAVYLAVQSSLFWNLSFETGARYEHSIQNVRTYESNRPENATETVLDAKDILPASSVTWKFAENMQMRGAFSETLSRPDFRELTDSQFNDDENGRILRGNPDLKPTLIKNYDLRWEWYPQPKETISLGVFYKHFTNPIEVTYLATAESYQMTFQNALYAENFGAEAELRKGLGFLERLSPVFHHMTIGANFALIDSQVHLDPSSRGVQTSSERPLQGQSPYIGNLYVDFQEPRYQVDATLLWNVFGERIMEVGTNRAPDVVEQEFQQLDLILAKQIKNNYKLSFKAKNILDPDVVWTQGDEIKRKYAKGREFSMGLSGSF